MEGRERRLFAWLALVSLLVGLVEMLGVLSVVPFIVLAGDPEAIERSARLAAAFEWTGLASRDGFLVMLGLACFAVLCIGVAIRTLAFYLMTRFVRLQSVRLETRLLARHLARPYAWHLRRNSADATANVLSETREVVEAVLLSAMRIVANGAIALCLVALLFAVEPSAALVMAGLLVFAYGGVFLVVRRRIWRMGAARLQARRETFRILQETLGGLKTVKLLQLEDRYVARFGDAARRAAAMQARVGMMREVPRGVLEAVTFGGMLLLTVWILSVAETLRAALPVLAIYALAGARLFPVLQKLYRAMASFRAGMPALAALEEGLAPMPEPPAARPIAMTRSLELDGVVYAFPGAGRAALNGVDLRIEAGETVALTGPSGAGKSTILDVILGLLVPDAGEVRIDGAALGADGGRAWQRSVGYVPQDIFLSDASIAENIAFGLPRAEIDGDALRRAARLAGLTEVVEGLPDGFETLAGERGARLSGGQAQRVAIARALYRDPDVLVFDEPTSALDGESERAVIDALERLAGRKTVILSTHRPAALRHATRVLRIEDGRVVERRSAGAATVRAARLTEAGA